jgi:hypothetical protein
MPFLRSDVVNSLQNLVVNVWNNIKIQKLKFACGLTCKIGNEDLKFTEGNYHAIKTKFKQ